MDNQAIDLEMLMRRAQSGDAKAYHQLLKETAGILRGYLRKWLKNPAEAEDVLQEVLISVHKARHTYDGNRPYKPWLLGITRFRLAEYWRRAYNDRLRQAVDLTEAENNLAAPVTESGAGPEYIVAAFKELTAKQAEIMRLMHIEGYTAKETGEKLAMSEGAVKVAAHRAYKILREKLKNYE